jgi:hypothetical protein
VKIDRSVVIDKTVPHRRVGPRRLLWRAEALDCSRKLARGQFWLQESPLIYEQLAELVDIELIRERMCL